MSLSCCLPWFWEAVDGEGDEMDDGLGQSSQVLRHHRLQLGQKGDTVMDLVVLGADMVFMRVI